MNSLSRLARLDISLAEDVVVLPWLSDGITVSEQWAAFYLSDLARSDLNLARGVVALPWFTDVITRDEDLAMNGLAKLAYADAALASSLVGQGFLSASVVGLHGGALWTLGFIALTYPDGLAILRQQAWFNDGITDDEVIFVAALGRPAAGDPEGFQSLVASPAMESESRTIELLLAGDIHLTNYRIPTVSEKGSEMQELEQAVRTIEAFMGVPFPQRDVIVVYGVAATATNSGNYIVVPSSSPLAHEVAHYYWSNTVGEIPFWFMEGSANFFSSYVMQQSRGLSLEILLANLQEYSIPTCKDAGIMNIQQLIAGPHEPPWERCNYVYGNNLFLRLYDLLGDDAFRTAWRELYLMLIAEGEMSEQEIYSTFLRNTPAAKLGTFEAIYTTWHGSDFSDQ